MERSHSFLLNNLNIDRRAFFWYATSP